MRSFAPVWGTAGDALRRHALRREAYRERQRDPTRRCPTGARLVFKGLDRRGRVSLAAPSRVRAAAGQMTWMDQIQPASGSLSQ